MTDTIDGGNPKNEERRDFLNILATATGVVGGGLFAWSVVDSMNPSQDVLALASVEIDISSIEVGQSVTVQWRGKPVFIRRRTEAEIQQALNDDAASLPDNEADAVRAPKPEWLIVVGVCTHLGCVPLGQASGSAKGDYDGWFCPCHGSHYDTSGRIRKGPAPKNLAVPSYEFLSDTLIKIG